MAGPERMTVNQLAVMSGHLRLTTMAEMARQWPCRLERTLLLALGVALMAAIFSGNARAAAIPARDQPAATVAGYRLAEDEARLARLRADLLRQLDGAPAHVLALSWIDARGALQQSTQFMSEGLLPGRSASAADAPAETGSCVNVPARLRSPALVSVSTDPLWSARHPSRAQHLRERMAQLIARRAAERGSAWFAVRGAEESGTAYWQALTGDVAEEARWQLEVRLGPVVDGWQLSAVLRSLDAAAGTADLTREWRVLPADFAHTTAVSAAGLDKALDELVLGVNNRVACAGPQYPVSFEQGRLPRLLVGRQSGLQVGDRLLLKDQAVWPRRGLSPGALGRLAIVEVTAVGSRRTELMPVAGLEPDGQGHWVAVPL